MLFSPRGTINGAPINVVEIDGGVVIKEMAADLSVAITQVVEAVRARLLAHDAGFTFQASLSELTRSKLLTHDAGFTLTSIVSEIIRTGAMESGPDIQFEELAIVDVLPAMLVDHVTEFVLDVVLDHVFFTHWIDGTRLQVPAEPRGLMVARDRRSIRVDPDPGELVRQKDRELVS